MLRREKLSVSLQTHTRAPKIALNRLEGIRKILIVSCVLRVALLRVLLVCAVETWPGKQLCTFYLLRKF